MGKLSTHVLDTYSGKPAANIRIQLWQLDGDSRKQVMEVQTNQDGRAPLLDPIPHTGEFELLFFVRGYFEQISGSSPFLNVVPVRFTIFDANANYHVPILVSPWSYTTYRGS